ncbi:MAG: hypothetical protein ACK56J_16830 [Planctomycetota bacterium]|jgi:hypothetical protein
MADLTPQSAQDAWQVLHSRSAVSFALLLSLFAGFAAVAANHLLYESQAPFFDSVSYYDKLHQVMTVTREAGLVEGWRTALHPDTTVCLPFLIAVPLALVIAPCREIGLGIQTLELFLFLWSLDIALRRLVSASLPVRRTCLLSFFSLACLYYQNGGLSDFRMDLSLMLLYGCSALWLMIALHDRQWASFFWLGLAIGAASLFRATAPVYFAFAFVPVAGYQMVMGSTAAGNKRRLLVQLIFAGAIAALAAGWYFLVNFDFLYYYYFVWNTDANARLPLSRALGHFSMAKRAIGDVGLLYFGTLATLGFLAWRRSLTNRSESNSPLYRIDWQWLWLATAPTLLLVSLRAGLNPFVNLPTAIGFFLFLTFWAAKWLDQLPRPHARVIWTCLLITLAVCGVRGWKKHQISANGSMASHLQVVDAIVDDAQARSSSQARYGMLQTTELNVITLWSTLLFDDRRAEPSKYEVNVDGVVFQPDFIFSQLSSSDWQAIPGSSNDEKLRHLVHEATQRLDYVVVAEAESVTEIQHAKNAPVINLHLPEIREALLQSKQWTQVSAPIETQPGRRYAVYRNLRTGSSKLAATSGSNVQSPVGTIR